MVSNGAPQTLLAVDLALLTICALSEAVMRKSGWSRCQHVSGTQRSRQYSTLFEGMNLRRCNDELAEC
jgi:hypothetical protein